MEISLKIEDWQEQLVLEMEFCGEKDWLDHMSAAFSGPLRLDATVVRLPGGLTIAGTLNVELQINCSLCFEPFGVAYTLPVQKQWWFETKTGREEEVLSLSQEKLDLRPLFEETLLLELPMIPKCQENCRGLCTQCGANLNLDNCSCQNEVIDFRWEKLKEWQKS